jgi:hypothetical protein
MNSRRLIRSPRRHKPSWGWGNCKAQCFGRLEVDDEFELHHLLHREISSLNAMITIIGDVGGSSRMVILRLRGGTVSLLRVNQPLAESAN